MIMKKTFEIQLLTHVDAETDKDAVKQFVADLKSRGLDTSVTIDVRDIASGEDAVELTYI